MNAVEYLNQAKMCDAKIKNKMLEKEQWFTLATKTTCPTDGERVQSSGSPDKMSDAVTRMIEIDKEIDEMIDSFVDLKQEIIKTIEQVNDPILYDILHMIYIQYMKPSEVSHSLNYTYQWIKELNDRGLEKIQMLLDNS